MFYVEYLKAQICLAEMEIARLDQEGKISTGSMKNWITDAWCIVNSMEKRIGERKEPQ